MAALNEIYHFLQLSDNLLTAGQPTPAQFEPVAAAGVKTVINLAMPSSSGAFPAEASIVEGQGMEYISIPVLWEAPQKADLDRFCLAMLERQQSRLFIHCPANMRVSVFVALFRILHLDWDRQAAFQDTLRIWDPVTDAVWARFIDKTLGG